VLAIGHLTRKYTVPGSRDLFSLPQNLLSAFAPPTTGTITTITATVMALDWILPAQRQIVRDSLPNVALVVGCIHHPIHASAPATTHDDDCARSSVAHGGARGCLRCTRRMCSATFWRGGLCSGRTCGALVRDVWDLRVVKGMWFAWRKNQVSKWVAACCVT